MSDSSETRANKFETFEDIPAVSFDESEELRLIYMDGEHHPGESGANKTPIEPGDTPVMQRIDDSVISAVRQYEA